MNEIKVRINNADLNLKLDPLRRLIDVLREELNYTASKEGCGEGECGACSVIIDGELVNSCLIPIGKVEGKSILTLEGLKSTKKFDILENAFIDAGAVQCGFCIPGMIMATEALLSKNPNPTEVEIRKGLSGNLCRCTGYKMIVDAVKLASMRGEGVW